MFYRKIIDYIHYVVLKTNKIALFKKFYYLIYKLSLKFIVLSLKKLEPIRSIYLEGSLANRRKNFVAGSSDIDLIIITKELTNNEEFIFLSRYVRKCVIF